MSEFRQIFPTPTSRWDLPIGSVAGLLFTILLFVCVPLAQMLGEIQRPTYEIEEEVIAFTITKVEPIEEERQEAEEREPPPELEERALPNLTLDQMDVALNVGAGGGGTIVGDFVDPLAFAGSVASAPTAFEEADIVDFADLDQPPRPLGNPQLRFPRRLLKNPAEGRILLRLKLSPSGEVLEAEIADSNLPDFDRIVRAQVAEWAFTPPTQNGRAVFALANFPIPIRIR